MAASRGKQRKSELASTIRKEIVKESNRRQLGRLPVFRPVEEIPEHLRMLLARLEQTQEFSGI